MKFNRHILGDIKQKFRKRYSLWLFSHSKRKQESTEILNLMRNKYKGRRAFLICNGPSLKVSDLDKIYKYRDISIASNKINKIFDKTVWRPDFYTVMDQGYQYSLKSTMNAMPSILKIFRQESFMVTRAIKGNCVYCDTYIQGNSVFEPFFFEDITQKLSATGTVTYAMLQILVHLGIREIYIIGCDNSYGRERTRDGSIIEKNCSSYFEGTSSADNKVIADIWQMNAVYEYARRYADTHDIKIKNATRGGYLEAFERVDFDSLFPS